TVETQQQGLVRARLGRVFLAHPPYTRGEAMHRKAEGFQHTHEEQVVFEAVAATLLVDQLGENKPGVEAYRLAAETVELLEGNGQWVQVMQRLQRCQIRTGLAARVADATEATLQLVVTERHHRLNAGTRSLLA